MMSKKRLIDANAADVESIPCYYGDHCTTEDVQEWLNEQPTVDAVEVVHARWLYDSECGKYFCSACDENALSFKKDALYGGDLYEVCLTDYCPNCGAKMDGGAVDG